MSSESKKTNSKPTSSRILMVGAALVLLIGAGFYFFGDRSGEIDLGTTFIAKRGDLQISVLEGGNIEAQKSQEIRSQIKGRTGVKILSIVEEGYAVSQEDIANGKVLVELDSSDLVDRRVNQEIATQSAEATFIERKAQFEIQLNQNQSNITAAELTSKFARMDFAKFLGERQVADIIGKLTLEERLAAADEKMKKSEITFKPEVIKSNISPETSSQRPQGSWEGGNTSGGSGSGEHSRGQGGMNRERLMQMIEANGGEIPDAMRQGMEARGINVDEFMERIKSGDMAKSSRPEPAPEPSALPQMDMVMDEEYIKIRASFDFSDFADSNRLEDGEAKQMLRNLEDTYQTAKETYLLSQTTLEGQRRLAEKNFITQSDLDLEELRVTQNMNRMESAEPEKKLYIQYTFPKEAEKLLSDYEEALMNLQRTKKEAGAKMAQENARLKSAQQKYNLEKEKLADLIDQIEKCVILAERPGMVVYGSSVESNPWRRSSQEPIQEGTTVRERQLVLVIPDMTQMGVKVNIHESSVQKVAIGQKAVIRVDAYPDITLKGEVVKVAVLADSANAFMNPDLKVYPTVVTIEGIRDWLRPGMSAEVEILVDTLVDVVYVPIQSVTFDGEASVCYVMENGKVTPRIVTTGAFTEDFIAIESGLEGGEEVLLLAPDSLTNPSGSSNEENEAVEIPDAA